VATQVRAAGPTGAGFDLRSWRCCCPVRRTRYHGLQCCV